MKPVIIIAIVIVLASIGLVFTLISQQGTNPNVDWNELRENLREHCEPRYLEDGFDSVEDCVMDILARVELATSGKSHSELLNEAHRAGCEQSNWQDSYETIEECIAQSWNFNDIRIETPIYAGIVGEFPPPCDESDVPCWLSSIIDD